MYQTKKIYIGNLLDVAAGDDALENRQMRQVRDLADELNSALPDYTVALQYLDTDWSLTFDKVDPTEGSHWEDRQELAEALETTNQDQPPS